VAAGVSFSAKWLWGKIHASAAALSRSSRAEGDHKDWKHLSRDQPHVGEQGFDADDEKLYEKAAFIPGLPIVAVDLDEVLGQFVKKLAEFHNHKFGTRLGVSDFYSYSFALVWGGTPSESAVKVLQFFRTRYFEDIPPIPGARDILHSLKHKYNFVVVTSRQHFIAAHTRRWLQTHYPGLFCDIVFGNHWAFNGKKFTKPELCEKVGASALIDDSLSYATECSILQDFKVVLFDWNLAYPWNKQKADQILPENVTRLPSWEHVKIFF